MKTELKLKQRLRELTNDVKAFTEEHEELSKVFSEKKRTGDAQAELFNPHGLELVIAEARGKVIILKEVLEIKD